MTYRLLWLGDTTTDFPPARRSTRRARVGDMENPNLDVVVREHLDTARRSDSGRAAETVYGGHEKTLRQTVIAMTAGTELSEHENPGEATLLVLQGAVRLRTGDETQEGRSGDLLAIPADRHSLEAVEDSAVLLTVAKLP